MISYSDCPTQSYPPIDHTRIKSSKTYFFQKMKKQDESFISMNQSMAQRSKNPLKIIKKFSFQIKNASSDVSPFGKSLQQIPRQKTVPKSKSANHIVKNGSQVKQRKNTRKVLKSEAQNEIKVYKWREMTHFPLIKISCFGARQSAEKHPQKSANQELELEINWNEDIKFRLNEIQQFTLINSLYIVNQSLVGFQRLYNKFGYFEPTLKMIFITNSSKCKIWANQNIWQNYPLTPKFVSKEHQKVEYFYKKIIKMFGKYFKAKMQKFHNHESQKRSVNLIEKLIYELERKNDFIQGMKLINEFVSAYNLKISNHFIYPIEVSDTRSRIFSKIQKSQPNKQISTGQVPSKQENSKNSSLLQNSQIPLKQEQQDEQEKNVKTLKNSYNLQSRKEVLQSNVETVIDKKTQTEQKEISLKKKSQISICSKQTIVEKKSRFSMYDPKQQNQVLNPLNSRHLPNFTNEDFNEEEDSVTPNEQFKEINEKIPLTNVIPSDKDDQEKEYQQQVRNQIERNVRLQNGWLQNPQLLFDSDQCAKSYQDSQPSVKMKIRDRNLSKLNRIKSSIAHSIID